MLYLIRKTIDGSTQKIKGKNLLTSLYFFINEKIGKKNSPQEGETTQ